MLVLKGQTKIRKYIFFVLPVVLFYHLDYFFCKLGLNVVLTAQKIHFKTHQYFTEIMTLLLKIIHKPCCEMFYVGKKVVPVSKKVVHT